MNQFTLNELTELLRECAGEEEGVDLDGDVLDQSFIDLGYDSLALLQATGQIELRHGIRIADEAVAEAETPRLYLDIVNQALGVPAA